METVDVEEFQKTFEACINEIGWSGDLHCRSMSSDMLEIRKNEAYSCLCGSTLLDDIAEDLISRSYLLTLFKPRKTHFWSVSGHAARVQVTITLRSGKFRAAHVEVKSGFCIYIYIYVSI